VTNFWDADPIAAPTAAPAKGANFWDADPVVDHPSVVGDVAKSAGTGLAKGAIGLAGIPGDVAELAKSGADWVGERLPSIPSPSPDSTLGRVAQFLKDESAKTASLPAAKVGSGDLPGSYVPPTSAQLQKSVEGVTGEFHKPQTTAGEYAQTIGEFAPGALAGGEGLLARLGKQAVAPALASETAGQLTKGTSLEPYARVAGAVAGGGLASTIGRGVPEVAAPAIEELKDAARSQYNHPDVKAVQINPDAATFLHHWIQNDLENGTNAGFRASDQPKTFSAISELSNPNQSMARSVGAPVTIDDISAVRKRLGRIASERDITGNPTSDAAAASRAIDHVNTFLENLRQPDLLQGNASRASEILQQAGQNWGAAKRAEEVATRAENARIQAGSTYGGGNINNALRQALRPLAKNDFQKARGFNQDERDALERVVTGNWLGNTARQVGKLGPDTGLKGIHHVAAAFQTGGASIPLSLAALAAKIGGDASTRRAIGRLDTTLRERSALHEANLANVNSPVIHSQVTPGVTLPNPNYRPPLPAPRHGVSALTQALLASAPYRGASLGLPQPQSP
jgi:hypothetical protein